MHTIACAIIQTSISLSLLPVIYNTQIADLESRATKQFEARKPNLCTIKNLQLFIYVILYISLSLSIYIYTYIFVQAVTHGNWLVTLGRSPSL